MTRLMLNTFTSSLTHVRARSCSIAAGLAIVASVAAGCAVVPMFVSEANYSYVDLNERLAKRFPIEKNIADLLTVKMTRPRLAADAGNAGTSNTATPARLAITMDLDVKLPLTSKSLWGAMTLSGVPRYDVEKRAVFLGDAKLERVRVDNMPDALSAGLASAASRIAKDHFEDKPIYQLRDEDLKKWGTSITPKRIDVRPNGLALVLR
jgi:hypothetical protein